MCNKLHPNFLEIPFEGIGYKIFQRHLRDKSRYAPMFNEDMFNKGWNHWDSRKNLFSDGFCFFLTKKTAVDHHIRFHWSNPRLVVCKIMFQYGKGKVIHKIKAPIAGNYNLFVKKRITYSICRKFKILEEIKCDTSNW